MILIMGLNLILNMIHHGEPKNDTYDIRIALTGVTIEALILTWGGFWC